MTGLGLLCLRKRVKQNCTDVLLHAALRSCGRVGGRVHPCLKLEGRVTANKLPHGPSHRLYLGASVVPTVNHHG
ncbi:unnamed protein product [Boreogadus saida]